MEDESVMGRCSGTELLLHTLQVALLGLGIAMPVHGDAE
jgi:hypothetical protein